MLTLLLFAILAGALTAITPCVLPVLTALLSASGTGGRRRPVGVVLGLSITHFLTIVALATVVEGVGLASDTTRTISIVVLAAVGIALLVPAVMHRVEEVLAPLARMGPKQAGDGLVSGLAVGGALGFAYAPCAGPILAAVISVSATQGASGEIVAIAFAYTIGSAAALLLVANGGRKLLAGRAAGLQRIGGAIMIVTALFIATNLDVRFQTALANDFPTFLSNPTRALEDSDRVERRLTDVRGKPKFAAPQEASTPTRKPTASAAPAKGEKIPSDLPDLGAAPELEGNQRWFNSKPTTLKQLRGKVVLVDFWTYTCINCIRTFPALRELDTRYRKQGLSVLGVHTPEFAFEKEASNVQDAIKQNKLAYPTVQDNNYDTWNAFGNKNWPTKYLIDAKGRVRYVHIGEGDEAKTEEAVRSLLRETGASGVAGEAPPPSQQAEAADPETTTPETYLGTERGEGWVDGPDSGESSYEAPSSVTTNEFAFDGRWKIGDESGLAVRDASITLGMQARKLFLVLASKGGEPRKVRVLVDGKPATAEQAGEDVKDGVATVSDQRLYRLVDLGSATQARVELRFDDGVRGFAFTFG